MPSKEQSKKSRYPSIFSPGVYITAAQYITELLFSKKFQFEKKDHPLKFWSLPQYKGQFVRWQRQANKLVKEFGGDAVIAALKDKRSGLRWSLHTEFMQELIKEWHEKLEQRKISMAESKPVEVAEGETFRQERESAGIKKLMELD